MKYCSVCAAHLKTRILMENSTLHSRFSSRGAVSCFWMNVPSLFHFAFLLRGLQTPSWTLWILRKQQLSLPSVPLLQAERKRNSLNLLELSEAELEEQFVRGDGPGGQATNKTNNCVVLKHIPSGIVVKVIVFYFIESQTVSGLLCLLSE